MTTAQRLLPPDAEALLVSGGLNFIAAVLILVAGWMLAGWVSRWTRRGLARVPFVDPTLKPLLASLLRYTILLATVVAVLQRFGVETTSLIAVFGAAGLAIGLAIQGTLANVAAGVMLLVLRPFHIGEVIELLGTTGTKGTVREIGLFRTIVATRDLIQLSIPNSTIFSATIVNYTREPVRRIDFDVSIDRAADIGAAQKIVVEALAADSRVLKAPAPISGVRALGEYAVVLIARCWVSNADQYRAPYDLRKLVKDRLHQAGIAIPVPRQAVAERAEGPAKSVGTSGELQ